ncbi:hypothetical protein A2Z53_01100 [Candidatus Giovannonibacteria bacterium RIFCSPHIGHO2_02_42_15]|uniref:Uncharacterized protein n=2 Tax=Candidatus Giovannoniibacteriota TaxID=1752738 RepID=A0A1F5VL96_9BACT|nr:MAG: hypothetical protein UV11_C0007G0020 [Candidatus Giovannonibacteria bacterium GW2011_GWF2_42_19]OGF63781.1 MAG: hypothetical protein A2Z53_01100 [Candidatus Giovannonibacteria bacterium RIFCSPHIGHO2_02_42_15]
MNRRKSTFKEQLNVLTTMEIMLGIIVFLPKDIRKFTDQAVFRFFKNLDQKRFRVFAINGELHSGTIRDMLSFLEMARVLTDWNTGYPCRFEVNADMLESIKNELANRRVLPKAEEILKDLSRRFLRAGKARKKPRQCR